MDEVYHRSSLSSPRCLGRRETSITPYIRQTVAGSLGGLDDDGVSRMLKMQMEYPLDYTDKWPSVETTVTINSFSNLDVAKCTYDADFTVTLDWLDFSLLEDIHYSENVKNRQYALSKWLRNTEQMFNPVIRIENCVEKEFKLVAEDSNAFPCIQSILQTQEDEHAEMCDVPWLYKKFHFCGTLKIQNCEAGWFPLDTQRLPIRITSAPLVGRTSLGAKREVKLMDPFVRAEYRRFENQKKEDSASGKNKLGPKDGNVGMLSELIRNTPRELDIVAFGCQNKADTEYQVELLLIRKGQRYIFDFLIQLLCFCCALCSCWVPFTADCVTNRLGISLMLLLTVVAFTFSRPHIINEVPYATFHDTFEQWTLVFIILVVVENLVVYNNCYDAWDDQTGKAGNEKSDTEEWGCQQSPFWSTSRYDLICIFLLISLVLVVLSYQIGCAQIYRILSLLVMNEQQHEYDIKDANSRSKERRRCVRVAFPLDSITVSIETKEEFEALCSATVKKPYFWSVTKEVSIGSQRLGVGHHILVRCKQLREMRWSDKMNSKSLPLPMKLHCIRVAEDKLHDRLLVRNKDSKSNHSEYEFQPYTRDQAVELMASIKLPCTQNFLLSAAERSKKNKSQKPNSKSFRRLETQESTLGCGALVFDPSALTFLIDIGTGEIGFYGYQMERPTRDRKLVLPIQNPNLKHKIEKTFFADYVDKSDGAELFSSLVVEKFAPMRDVAKVDVKVVVAVTGLNRESSSDAKTKARYDGFMLRVRNYLQEALAADLIVHPLSPAEEAECELRAVDFLVQRADLDVYGAQGANGMEFAEHEIHEALNGMKKSAGENFTVNDFLQEFRDLKLAFPILHTVFRECPVDDDTKGSTKHRSIECMANHIRGSELMVRSLVRARLFCGTLAAGGGSIQFTYNSPVHVSKVLYVPVKLGNKSALGTWPTAGKLTDEHLEAWRRQVRNQLHIDSTTKHTMRGFYVGISAVAHASKKAGFHGRILARNECLRLLDQTVKTLDRSDPKERLNFSNLIMVHEVIEWFLHRKAYIVCKREWELGSADDNFVATWGFGFWLKATESFKSESA